MDRSGFCRLCDVPVGISDEIPVIRLDFVAVKFPHDHSATQHVLNRLLVVLKENGGLRVEAGRPPAADRSSATTTILFEACADFFLAASPTLYELKVIDSLCRHNDVHVQIVNIGEWNV